MDQLTQRVTELEEKLDTFMDTVHRGVGTTIPGLEDADTVKKSTLANLRGLKLISAGIRKIKVLYKRSK